jgi:hypothetical protein
MMRNISALSSGSRATPFFSVVCILFVLSWLSNDLQQFVTNFEDNENNPAPGARRALSGGSNRL